MLELRASIHRIEVDIDDTVEVARSVVRNIVKKFLVVKLCSELMSRRYLGRAMDARLQTATSSFADVYSMISVHRLEERMVPKFF